MAKIDDALVALATRVDELETALRPFAEQFSPGMENCADDHAITEHSQWSGRCLTVGDLIRAKRTLNRT